MSKHPLEGIERRARRPHGAPRVALVHYWLIGMRGGERVLQSLCQMFPQADIFTHVIAPSRLNGAFDGHRVQETFIGRLPFAKRLYQSYLPLMPSALESLDLTGYDLVISSEAGPAKGVIAPPDAAHLCYCHSPMRYLWDQYHVYREGAGSIARLMMPLITPRLRQWDVTSAARVDRFVANSRHVASRIEKYWRRDSDVVHPPVQVEEFAPVPRSEHQPFYLWVGELVSYKRPDLAIEAFNRLGLPLVVIGGPSDAVRRLSVRARDNITFLGKADFPTLKAHMARCRALIFPGEEDFGIVPVEVMASGRPVIAYGRGGALDTVIDGETGLLFDEQSVDDLIEAVERFESDQLAEIDTAHLVNHARLFDEATFKRNMRKSLRALGVPISWIS